MKGVDSIKPLDLSLPGITGPTKSQKTKTDFQSTLESVRESNLEPALNKDPYIEMQALQTAVLSGKGLSGRELIVYQIKANQFNMRVELVSKIADGVMTSLRKFQNNQ